MLGVSLFAQKKMYAIIAATEFRPAKRFLRETKKDSVLLARPGTCPYQAHPIPSIREFETKFILKLTPCKNRLGHPPLLTFNVRIFLAVFFGDRLWGVFTAPLLLYFRLCLSLRLSRLSVAFYASIAPIGPIRMQETKNNLAEV